ncbi:ATP-grasp domain-containing protein [Stappia sp. ES.058]|uniref:ATP-grasp domain-containing protein n=1 Tax=Stappia sp. ES.058 TaxID=1881061 RepID=UPI00087CD903|nr:ATP-grasp domain-containing protein [Stappia sp. ES.058]SDT95941.1 ATP-grasp domain-containing protein [Stappia sp. ES.058]
MSKTVLLTLGRMPKCLDLARGFHALGWRVVVAEPFAWHLCRALRAVEKSVRVAAPANDPERYLDDLRAVIKRESVDLVVPVSEETLHVARLAADHPGGARLYAPPQPELIDLHDKLRFATMMRALGPTVAETHAAASEAGRALAARRDYVLKPANSCAGLGVSLHAAGTRLPLTGMVVQEHLEGRHLSSFSILHEGNVRATSVYCGLVMSGTVAVCFDRVAAHHDVEDFIVGLGQKTGYSGFVSFDFIEGSNGQIQAIECNPRVTSGIHFLEAKDVAAAIADPHAKWPVRFRPHTLMQQFYPCLIEWQSSLFNGRERDVKWRVMRLVRDVTWDRCDPLVFPTMAFTSYPILVPAVFQGKPMGEAATKDIVWSGVQAEF